jgi:tRNA pseudouridine55 synthase
MPNDRSQKRPSGQSNSLSETFGVLNVLKPPGMSSHDVVNFVRRVSGIRRVGHGGTLDPQAAGVLPIFLGRATRLSQFVIGDLKRYRAELTLGLTSETYDLSVGARAVADASHVQQEYLEHIIEQYRGVTTQSVPAYSAVSVDGTRLYKLARKGVRVPQITRDITIISLEIVGFAPGLRPRVMLDIACSKGTYIRTLCHDIGQTLGVGGVMSFLIRTAAGPFELESSVTLEQVKERFDACLLAPEVALGSAPRAVLSREAARKVCHGVMPDISQFTEVPSLEQEQIVVVTDPDGRFLAVGQSTRQHTIEIRKVFCG